LSLFPVWRLAAALGGAAPHVDLSSPEKGICGGEVNAGVSARVTGDTRTFALWEWRRGANRCFIADAGLRDREERYWLVLRAVTVKW